MRKITCAVACGFICNVALYAQDIQVQPRPQEMKVTGQLLTLPQQVQLVGLEQADTNAAGLLKELLQGRVSKKGFKVFIGEKGDKAVKKFARFVPKKAESYYLSIEKDKLVLVGSDERGTFYGMQTLNQLYKNGTLPQLTITDYPDIRFRGVVEGFYGKPWSFEDRVSQLKFYGFNKMNTYIYGPKDDPYHSCPNWRKPYPQKEAERMAELVRLAKSNKVDFVWAIHPGQDIKWNDEDRKLLLDKFESMYNLGVRSFAVFFDDISGEGTNAAKQAELLNYIDDNFVKVKKDVTPLVMCPTEYNKSWSNVAGGYLKTLGDKLNPSIQIMWTGDKVVADIHSDGMAWINGLIKRPAYIWWNFPVTDYVRDHLLMGPVYGNDTNIADMMSGFVSNPMEHAEASKIAIYGVADYTWNMEKYDSDDAWKRSLKAIMPISTEAFQVFATHNQDLGPNGHGYRRVESVEMKPVAERFLNAFQENGTYEKTDFTALEREFKKIISASDVLLRSKDNEALINDINPWIKQFGLLGQTGLVAMDLLRDLENSDKEGFKLDYSRLKELKEQTYELEAVNNRNPYQPGVKTGSLVMAPFVNNLFAQATERFNKQFGENLMVVFDYCPHTLESNISQLKSLPLQLQGKLVNLSPSNEVIKAGADAFVTINLVKPVRVRSVEFNAGKEDVLQWGELQYSVDGESWKPLTCEQEGELVKGKTASGSVKAVRFINKSGKPQEFYMRKFVLNI
ncbi:beta-N-acetylglucosaminidase [Bacteroides sedimenti]